MRTTPDVLRRTSLRVLPRPQTCFWRAMHFRRLNDSLIRHCLTTTTSETSTQISPSNPTSLLVWITKRRCISQRPSTLSEMTLDYHSHRNVQNDTKLYSSETSTIIFNFTSMDEGMFFLFTIASDTTLISRFMAIFVCSHGELCSLAPAGDRYTITFMQYPTLLFQ